MKIRFLGTGTSTGVPQLRCDCEVCLSADRKDKRMRASALIEANGKNILIDCGPDFYHQMLEAGQPEIDAVLLTHSHYDHVGGIDDLRPWCYAHDGMDVYCQTDVDDDLRARIPYSFREHLYPGVPTFHMHDVKAYEDFKIGDVTVTPIKVMHGKLPILGFRIGKMAYITDCKTLPEESLEKLKGVDTLVINALRYREHQTHMDVAESLAVVELVKPKRTYFTHMSHDIGKHAAVNASLPTDVELAYDGLEVEIEE